MTIKSTIRCFELTLRPSVNFHKSKLNGIGVDKDILERFSRILNCFK